MQHAQPAEHKAPEVNPTTEAHAGSHEGTYLLTFIALMILTLAELVVTYIPTLKIPLLLAFAALKAGLVVAFFMHLRYERRYLAVMFVVPITAGVLVALAIQQLVLR